MSPRIAQGLAVLLGEGIALLLLRQLAIGIVSWLARRASALPGLRNHPEQVAAAALHVRRRMSRLMLLLFAGAAAFDAYVLFYLREDLAAYTRGLLPHVDAEAWHWLARRAGVAALVGVGIVLVSGWIGLGVAAARKRKEFFARAEVVEADVEMILDRLSAVRRYGAVLVFAWATALLLEAPESVSHGLSTVLRIYLIIALSRLGVIVAVLLVEGMEYLARRYMLAETEGQIHEQIRSLKPVLTRSIEYIVYVGAASLVLLELEPAQIKGVQSFNDGHLVVRMVVKAKPGKQGPVGRQYRRMTKDTFDREGIEMPFASQVITLREAATAQA